MNSPTKTSKRWPILSDTIEGTAHILNLYGWTEKTVEEYIRPLMSSCKQGEAVNAFRDLYDETGKMPTSDAVLLRIGAKKDKQDILGEAVFLRASDGFCYAGSGLSFMVRPESVNGKTTGRMINNPLSCGCRVCRPGEWCEVAFCPTKPKEGMPCCYFHKDTKAEKVAPERPSRWERRAEELNSHGGSPQGFRALLSEMAHSKHGAVARDLAEAVKDEMEEK